MILRCQSKPSAILNAALFSKKLQSAFRDRAMTIRLLFVGTLVFASAAHAGKDTNLSHDADLISGMAGVSNSCVTYALRKTGSALASHLNMASNETRERDKAWRNITYTHYLEACVAEVAREFAETATFDLDEGKADLQKLDPLYVIEGPPKHIDVSVTMVSANTIRFGGETMSMGNFLDKVWAERWRDIVVNEKVSSSGLWCLLHLGYISGARIHIHDADGSWPKAILNAGTGEKGTALTINQCLSGNPLDESQQH
jgi:hypothetical protein